MFFISKKEGCGFVVWKNDKRFNVSNVQCQMYSIIAILNYVSYLLDFQPMPFVPKRYSCLKTTITRRRHVIHLELINIFSEDATLSVPHLAKLIDCGGS